MPRRSRRGSASAPRICPPCSPTSAGFRARVWSSFDRDGGCWESSSRMGTLRRPARVGRVHAAACGRLFRRHQGKRQQCGNLGRIAFPKCKPRGVVNPGDAVTVVAGTYQRVRHNTDGPERPRAHVFRAAAQGVVRLVGPVSIRTSYVEFSGFASPTPICTGSASSATI